VIYKEKSLNLLGIPFLFLDFFKNKSTIMGHVFLATMK
jgi:hypothetical protein